MGAADRAMDFRGALVDDIPPYWERSVDREHGGFFVHLDEQGVRYGDGPKDIMTTTRMFS